MAKRATAASAITEPQPVAIRSKLKLLFSALIAIHLLAVIAEPFAFFTRGANSTSPAALPIRVNLAPYVEFLYLNHGYFFFAPNPGPSHLLECQLKTASGEQSRLRLPDRNAQWPRLLYHRHFMLAEFLHGLHVPPVTAQDEAITPDKELLSAWRTERARFEMVRDSMLKHLRTRYEVESAEILRLEHRLPSDVEVFRDKVRLSDERLYVILPDSPIDEIPTTPFLEPVPESPDSKPGFIPGNAANNGSVSKPILRPAPNEQTPP